MKSEDSSQITSLGKVLAAIPLVPKYAKMLLQARSDKVNSIYFTIDIELWTVTCLCLFS